MSKRKKPRRRRTSVPDSNVVSGAVGYKQEQWHRWLAEMDDADGFEGTYEEWEKNTHEAIRQVKASGVQAELVTVDIDEFIEWCRENEKPKTAESRVTYMLDVLRQRDAAK